MLQEITEIGASACNHDDDKVLRTQKQETMHFTGGNIVMPPYANLHNWSIHPIDDSIPVHENVHCQEIAEL